MQRIHVMAMLVGVVLVAVARTGSGADLTSDQLEFFETRIRPVLVEHCYACHNSTKQADGGLAVDQRSRLLKGGDEGAVIVPGKPKESRLLKVLRHEVPGLKMPQGGAKLDDRILADFEKWIEQGAPDPRNAPPSVEELSQATSWEAVLAKRKQWWSLQPIKNPAPPEVSGPRWSEHAVDRFILSELRRHELEPNERADARTLVRRTYFALIGLPPTPEEARQWAERIEQPQGFEALVDHLLASPHFGERWARHWMDWIRYCDSHGSEGDPALENGWLYRDYLIRALNADVSYSQLVREHIAGDLMPEPRLNRDLGLNESLIATAHWRMVFHGFAPTDALDEKVRFVDDQINAFSKAFLGLTVSCARCHDHKFDAISQQDYYALFGIFNACRPGRSAADIPEKQQLHREQLAALKPRLRSELATVWQKSSTALKETLLGDSDLWKKADSPRHVLHAWAQLRKDVAEGQSFEAAWQKRVAAWKNDVEAREKHAKRPMLRRWQLGQAADAASWTRTGIGLSEAQQSAAGEFAIAPEGDAAVTGIYPAGLYSHRLSSKHAARLTSRDVKLNGEYSLWMRVSGEAANARYVVHDYPRGGTVYPIAGVKNDGLWQRLDMSYWDGDDVHVELTAGPDAPLQTRGEARSWIGVREVAILKKDDAPPTDAVEFLDPWMLLAASSAPTSLEAAAERFTQSVSQALQHWAAGAMSDSEALLLDACLRNGVLPNKHNGNRLIAEYRQLEAQIAVPTRVPTLEEAADRQQPLYVRGNHKQPGDVVPRRFLEAMNSTPYPANSSGRLQLADDVLSAKNPLTRRVIVNRLWHHLFGRGIVGTPDNFGRLGHLPTHPELLDHLASQFEKDGGSIKRMIRHLVTSRTWQQSSQPSAKSLQVDPDNQWLSHAFARRLEAEAIRDALLAVSGTLSRDLYGAPVDGGSNRRSVYMRVQRNSLDPFLRSFDFPEPFTAVGRRDVTNVPAQSLTLMNDERVAVLATSWSSRLRADAALSDESRIQRLFETAFSRSPTAAEQSRFVTYLADVAKQQAETEAAIAEKRLLIEHHQTAVREKLDPIRQRLLDAAKQKVGTPEATVPQPIARWEFESDVQDAVGSAHGELKPGAKLENGAVVVEGSGHVVTAPLQKTLKAKTLEAWVQLANLDQRGGGVITVQSRDGTYFDSIVFGEQNARQWMAGSNFFARTQPFNGPVETEGTSRPVHVAIAYHSDGRIVGYRDGQPYGKPYSSNGPFEFKAGETVVSFGLRHLPVGGNRLLAGRILKAQIYDRALNDDEIAATAKSVGYLVTEAQVLAELSADDRKWVSRERLEIANLEQQLAEMAPYMSNTDRFGAWTDLARAIFTFKEFVFVK